jgi:purine catabolism regulator
VPPARSEEAQRSEEVQRALVSIVLDGGGLGELAGRLASLLKGAVIVTSQDGRVLADAGEDTALSAARQSGCFEQQFPRRATGCSAGVLRSSGTAGNHIVTPVTTGRTDHGRITVFSPDGALTVHDVPLVERASAVIALAVTSQLAAGTAERKFQGDFLRDVLTGRIGTEPAVRRSAGFGWEIDRPLLVAVAEFDPAPGEPPAESLVPRPAIERFSAAWASAVRRRDPHAAVAGFHREVVAVLGTPQRGDSVRFIRDLVREVGAGGAERRPFSTGVSRRTVSPSGIPAAYEQARTAVRVGRRMHGPGAVAHFDRLGVSRVLSLVEDQSELRSFAEETLGELARPDETGNDGGEVADLRRTLEVLLETNLNVAETARLLHFHYNTLRYRIVKLERMLGPFTRDPHLRLSLQVALQVLHLPGAC